jgi:trehalose 6-phosphate phosphatase
MKRSERLEMNIAEDIKPSQATAPEPELPLLNPLADWAVFLDVDGTLLDIAPSPDAVVVPAGLTDLLTRLRDALGGALALVTGREIAVVDKMFAPLKLPVAGVHGAELRLADGVFKATPISPAMPRIVAELEGFVAENEGLLLERKGRAVALHYRQNPALGEDVETFVRDVVESDGTGLEIQPGKMVVEVRPAKVDKGRAVSVFLEEEPYLGRTPLVMGDDWTDEPAFRTANARGGRSVRIGRDKRATEANEYLADPAAVRQWLSLLVRQ